MSNNLAVLLMAIFAGRETPSVAGIINPGSEGFQKLFFGQEEIAIPVHSTQVLMTSNILFNNYLNLRAIEDCSYLCYLFPWIGAICAFSGGINLFRVLFVGFSKLHT